MLDHVFRHVVHFLSVPSLSLRLLLLARSRRHEFEEERRPQRAQVDGQSGQSSRQHHVFAPVADGPQHGLSHVGWVPTRLRVLVHDCRRRSTGKTLQSLILSIKTAVLSPRQKGFPSSFCRDLPQQTPAVVLIRLASPPYLEPSPVTALSDRLVRM